MGSWLSGRCGGYAVGLLAVVLVAGIRLVLDPFIDTNTPSLLFLAAVMTAAWYGGLKPGLSATLLAALTSQYLFMQEGLSFTPTRLGDAGNLAGRRG